MNTTEIQAPPDWRWHIRGVGFLPFNGKPVPYGQTYFDKYAAYAATPQGAALNEMRCDMVERWVRSSSNNTLLEIGIGAGSFLQRMRNRGWKIWGDDINPHGIMWLRSRNYFWGQSPYTKANVLIFWDVLEHIEVPSDVLNKHKAEWVFIAMPIYVNEEHALTSKHFRPGEHCWYFTRAGLICFMRELGYMCVEFNKMETIHGGREGIESFAFRRLA